MKDWWLAQSPRDRRILMVGGLFALIAGVYSLLWEPLHQRGDKYRQQIQEESQLLQWMLEHSAEAKRLMAGSPMMSTKADGGTLLSLVDQQAKKTGLGAGLKRVEPAGKDQVRLWFENVLFDSLVSWLVTLEQKYGADVDSATLDSGESPGRVNARIVIKREDA